MSGTELAEKKGGIQHVQPSNATTPAQLLELAIGKDLDIEKLERLMTMQEQWEAKEAKKLFFEALASFQQNCPRIIKNKAGYDNRYRYTPLGDIVDKIRTPLKECGLTYRFEQNEVNNLIEITCIITHVAGHSERTKMSAEDDTSGSKNKIQAKGSTVTYLQRYTLIGALGIATADNDDDGEAVSAKQQVKPVETLSKEQTLNIQALLDDKGYPIEDFLQVAKVEKVDDIPAQRYEKAVSHIQKWGSKS